MSDPPAIARGPRRTRFVQGERADQGSSVVTAARHAARAAFDRERLQSSPLGPNHPSEPTSTIANLNTTNITTLTTSHHSTPPIRDPRLHPPPASPAPEQDAGSLETGEMAPPYQDEDTSEVEEDETPFDEADDNDLVDDMMDRDLGEEDLNDDDDHEHEDQADADEPLHAFDPAALGLKEVNNLAKFYVSSHKLGFGVDELLDDDLINKYWQSDGQQPHLLTIHFLRRVEIRAIRFYVDYSQDESYTPTNIVFHAGTSHHDLVQFAEMQLTNPRGWQDVPIGDIGGGHDSNSLSCFIVQIHIKENHQNGKDTHIRGIKIYALDESAISGPVIDAMHELDAVDSRHMQPPVAGANIDYDDPELQRLIHMLGENENSTDLGFTIFTDPIRDPEVR